MTYESKRDFKKAYSQVSWDWKDGHWRILGNLGGVLFMSKSKKECLDVLRSWGRKAEADEWQSKGLQV